MRLYVLHVCKQLYEKSFSLDNEHKLVPKMSIFKSSAIPIWIELMRDKTTLAENQLNMGMFSGSVSSTTVNQQYMSKTLQFFNK